MSFTRMHLCIDGMPRWRWPVIRKRRMVRAMLNRLASSDARSCVRIAPPVASHAWRRLKLRLGSGLVVLSIIGCSPSTQPTEPFATPSPPAAHASTWDEVLAQPADITVEQVISARWVVSQKGLINLHHPTAKQSGLTNEKIPIVLPVGIIRHPQHGDFVVDTGIDHSMAIGKPTAVKGLLKPFLGGVQPVEDLAAIRDRLDLDIRGVLLTHAHPDHVLGLPDIPTSTPIYIGPGELDQHYGAGGLLRPTYHQLFDGRPALREFDPSTGVSLDPFPAAIDVLGDGSIWAIPSPGHTDGSVAYLVNAASGPKLFVGDTSHTWWGWDHGVEPGTFTSDQERNAQSLKMLKTFVERYPQTEVFVGHEPARNKAQPESSPSNL